jgi:hypothetical protein
VLEPPANQVSDVPKCFEMRAGALPVGQGGYPHAAEALTPRPQTWITTTKNAVTAFDNPVRFGTPPCQASVDLLNGEMRTMPDAQPTHGIFIKYGRFHADAFGRPAVLTILLALVVGLAGRLLGIS